MNQIVYVVEYVDGKPVYQMTFSGVSAGLSEIETLEEIYPTRHYKLQYESIRTATSPTKKFPEIKTEEQALYEKRSIANWRKLTVLLKDEFLVQVEEIEGGIVKALLNLTGS